MAAHETGIDGKKGRVIALIVILICVAALIFINWKKIVGSDAVEQTAISPELAACLEMRVGAVDAMRTDNVINDTQYDLFRSRAEAFCETEFGEPANLDPTSLDPY